MTDPASAPHHPAGGGQRASGRDHHDRADAASHHHGGAHGHTHGFLDPRVLSTERGIWAVIWSFMGLSTISLEGAPTGRARSDGGTRNRITARRPARPQCFFSTSTS
jgi:hypothetical protein